jgi:predicted permease
MFWRKRKQADFAEEIGAHLALEVDRLRADGMSQSEAEAAARREFGNVARAEERFYESSRWLWLEHLKRDFTYALRVLRRSPGFTTVAVLSLALGIGVNALVFSVVNALVLRPLPIDGPEQVVFVAGGHHRPGHSFPNYRDVRDRNQSFSGLVAYRVAPMDLETRTGADRIWGYLATGNYFDVLGIHAALGHFFHQEDDLHPGASPYAVLSYNCWQGRFDADPDIVGKTIRINRQSFTVLGVAPKDFHGTELFYWPEVWVPMMMEAQIEVGNPWLESRTTFNSWVIGRLKPGVTPAQATADLNTVAADLARQYPDANEGLKFSLARPGLIGDTLGDPTRAFALGVLILSGLVLLAACTNLASLVTARGSDRQREIAIRLSIGATRWRIVRQVLTETLVLALLGGATGYGLAVLLSRLLSQWHAPTDAPVQFNVEPDWRVFFFAFAVSLTAGLLFGTAPASHASKTDAQAVLKGEQGGWRGRRLALRDVLVVFQVALCFVLVSACLFSLRGLQQSLALHLGFQPEGVSAIGFDLGMAGYTQEQGRNFQRQALEAMQQLPGVASAAYSNSVPLSIDQNNRGAASEDIPNPKLAEELSVFVYEVSPQYFKTLGIELLAGRDFDWHDDRNSPLIAIVNRAFGKQVMKSNQPLGKHFRFGDGRLIEIVGVVEDGKYETLTESEQPAVFEPMLQRYNTTTTLLVRSSMPEAEMLQQMRRAMTQLDPHLPLYGTGSLRQMLGLAFFPARAAAIALSAFGVLAIMLAVTGIHGLVSYGVARRVREIGIRMAVGARPVQVVKLVLGRILMLLLIGGVIGLGLALAAGQVLASIVYQASPRDPLVLAAVITILALIGLLSSLPPTRRALRIEPTVALRHE